MTNDEARSLANLTHSLRKCSGVAVQHCWCLSLHEHTIAGIDEAEARGELYHKYAVPIADHDFSWMPR